MPAKKSATRRAGSTGKASTPKSGSAWGGIGAEAVAKATGKNWDQWCKLLDKDGAAKMAHKDIALHVRKKYGIGDWWCQMVTVGYEQARGLRVKHQTASGYVANLSQTLPVTMAAAFRAVSDAGQRAKWLEDPVTVTRATAGKSVRMTMDDGTRVVVGFYDKTRQTGAKTQVVFQHEKLKNAAAVTKSKTFWAAKFKALAEQLSA